MRQVIAQCTKETSATVYDDGHDMPPQIENPIESRIVSRASAIFVRLLISRSQESTQC